MGVGGDAIEDAQTVSINALIAINRPIDEMRFFTDDLLMDEVPFLIGDQLICGDLMDNRLLGFGFLFQLVSDFSEFGNGLRSATCSCEQAGRISGLWLASPQCAMGGSLSR